MVANFNPTWRGITEALRLAVVAAGGTPSVTTYPANWGGAIRAIDDLKLAIQATGGSSAVASHVAQADPHSQYALDSDLAAYASNASLSAYATNTSLTTHTSNTSNPHATTAAQVGAVGTADARLTDTRTPTDGSVTDAKVATGAAIGWAKVSKVGAVAADVSALASSARGAASGVASLDASTLVPYAQIPVGTAASTIAAGNDARLTDTRTPTDGSVTNAKVATGAAIALSKLATDPLARGNHTGTQTAATVSDFAATATSIAFILGEVRAFAMAAPVKWLACDGAAISRTTYAALFAAVGTAWGVGDGSTTFNLPDLRGRTPIGAGTGSSLTARTLAATGGAETHTLTTAEMPSHTHNNNIAGGTSGTAPRFSYVANDGNAITQTLSTGGGGAHNNMQPFAVVNYAIYTGV